MERTKITFDALRAAHWFCTGVVSGKPSPEWDGPDWRNRIVKWKKESDPVYDRFAHPLFYDRVLHTWRQDGKDVEYMDELI